MEDACGTRGSAVKYVSRKKEIVAWDYFTNGTYGETRLYKSYVYKRADGTEFLNLRHPQPVKRDYKNKPYTVRHAWHVDCYREDLAGCMTF